MFIYNITIPCDVNICPVLYRSQRYRGIQWLPGLSSGSIPPSLSSAGVGWSVVSRAYSRESQYYVLIEACGTVPYSLGRPIDHTSTR